MSILKGSGDRHYPYILALGDSFPTTRIHLERSEIRHNLPSISISKVYNVLNW